MTREPEGLRTMKTKLRLPSPTSLICKSSSCLPSWEEREGVAFMYSTNDFSSSGRKLSDDPILGGSRWRRGWKWVVGFIGKHEAGSLIQQFKVCTLEEEEKRAMNNVGLLLMVKGRRHQWIMNPQISGYIEPGLFFFVYSFYKTCARI